MAPSASTIAGEKATTGAGACRSGFRLNGRVIAERDQNRRDRNAENRRADEGAAPAPLALHDEQARRRDSRPEHAGKGVHREGLADTVGWHVLREQRVVRGVIDRVAHAQKRKHGNQHPE